MLKVTPVALGLLLSLPAWAAERHDPCAAATTAPEVRFELYLKDHGTTFQAGEIIPLGLSFTSSVKGRYTADVRNYDRSGRLDIERYCVEPAVADPLDGYFKFGAFIGGGLGSQKQLDDTPLLADAELNEYRSLPPGRYRVYAVSSRVWRLDPNSETPTRITEVVRSNSVDIEIAEVNPAWQAEQLREALQAFADAPSAEDAKRAARVLRFLNTPDSARALARLWTQDSQLSSFELRFGLYGSPHRQVAIDAMRSQISARDHPVTSDYVWTLANLQLIADPAWEWPAGMSDRDAREFSQKRRSHLDDLTKTILETAVAGLAQKQGTARALTLSTLVSFSDRLPTLRQSLRSALAASWGELPPELQREMIQIRWPLLAGAEMVPVLRKMLAEPPPAAPTAESMARDAALGHLYELDAAAGREAILADALNPKAHPGIDLVELLSKEDLARALPPALKRMESGTARELDYELVARYAGEDALPLVQAVYEQHAGKWACALQSSMLRYFLRVAPEYGVGAVTSSLAAREDTGCYRSLFTDLGPSSATAQKIAVEALDDPNSEVVRDAAAALGRWGFKDAEAHLWARLKRLHEEWKGRESELRRVSDFQSAAGLAAALEQSLVAAIAKGTNWICPPDKLTRVADLVWAKSEAQQLSGWAELWRQSPATITGYWYPEKHPTFSVLQYDRLTEDQLSAKLEQLPAMELQWPFWSAGQSNVSLDVQEKSYERIRAAAARHGIVVAKRVD